MIDTVLTSILVSVISVLSTYFVTTVATRGKLREIAQEIVSVHVESKHRDEYNPLTLVNQRMQVHESACNGNQRLFRIERALIWLVVKSGGSPKEVGLE